MTIRQRIQILLLVLLLAASIRLLLIYRSRHEEPRPRQAQSTQLDADAYVVPKRLHAYDLASLRELVGKPVWIKGGYQITYYPYNSTTKRAGLNQEAGLLGPIERLEIKDVVKNQAPASNQWQGPANARFRIHADEQYLLVVFEKAGGSYVFPVGTVKNGNYEIYTDEILYYEDPHELYKHWPADTWQAIDRHEVKPGMNELQVQFAIGIGIPHSNGSGDRVLQYANGRDPVEVIFRNGRANKISKLKATTNTNSKN